MMKSGGFNLRGWEWTNDNSSEKQIGVLGILWDNINDNLTLNLKNLENFDLKKITKRTMLSVSHRIYDPIGIVCPITLIPQFLLQETCKQDLFWD